VSSVTVSGKLPTMTRAEAGSERRLGWALALTSTLTMAVSYFDRQTLAVLAPS